MLKKLVVLGLVGLSLTGCTKVMDSEVGIRETFTGEIEEKVLTQGLHQTVVGDVIKVSKRNLVLNVNGNPIVQEKIAMKDFQMKVNYGIVSENAAIAYKTEKAQNMTTPDGDVYLLGHYVGYVAKSAINDVVSRYKALEVNDNRTKIESEIKDAINKKLEQQGKSKFVRVNEINILNITPPDQITASSAAILKSEQDLKTRKNELEVAKIEAEIKKTLAQNANKEYVELLKVEAEKLKAEALLTAAKKGTLNTMVVVPEKFTSLGQVK